MREANYIHAKNYSRWTDCYIMLRVLITKFEKKRKEKKWKEMKRKEMKIKE